MDVRRKLGVGPGGKIVVRRAGKFTFEDIHRKIFGTRTPKRRSLKEMKEGIAEHVRERYARD